MPSDNCLFVGAIFFVWRLPGLPGLNSKLKSIVRINEGRWTLNGVKLFNGVSKFSGCYLCLACWKGMSVRWDGQNNQQSNNLSSFLGYNYTIFPLLLELMITLGSWQILVGFSKVWNDINSGLHLCNSHARFPICVLKSVHFEFFKHEMTEWCSIDHTI